MRVLSNTLEDVFGTKMVSHRAGRFGFNAVYARALIDQGYRIDCSVTPGVSWRDHPGRPGGPGGPDYTGFPDEAYFVDPADVRRPGASPLLEVPVTIGPPYLSRPARLALCPLHDPARGPGGKPPLPAAPGCTPASSTGPCRGCCGPSSPAAGATASS